MQEINEEQENARLAERERPSFGYAEKLTLEFSGERTILVRKDNSTQVFFVIHKETRKWSTGGDFEVMFIESVNSKTLIRVIQSGLWDGKNDWLVTKLYEEVPL